MRIRGRWIAVVAFALGGAGSRLDAAVNLMLSPQPQSAAVGETVRVSLLAVSSTGTNEAFSAMDVILIWDPSSLSLLSATNDGPVAWAISGFMDDSALDGINNTFADGDAVYTVASISPVNATPTGVRVVTFLFEALGDATHADIAIVGSRGWRPAITKVFAAGQVNTNVTGSLGSVTIAFVYQASISIDHAIVPSGRNIDLAVHAEVADEAFFGLTLVVQLVPGTGAIGDVSFTPAPPTDAFVIDDPWPTTGAATVYDTDLTGSLSSNGAVLDNGTLMDEPLSYVGTVAAFPVFIDSAARGTWAARLCLGACGEDDTVSQWEALPLTVPTTRLDGSLTIVAPGDGDGNGRVELRDFAHLQECFTGAVGPVDPPAYASTVSLPCGVYDFDGDGDVDSADYIDFNAANALMAHSAGLLGDRFAPRELRQAGETRVKR